MVLDPVTEQDHPWLVELHNDSQVLRNVTDPTPVTLDGHLRWWSGIEKNSRERRLIFKVDEQRIGFTKFYAIDNANRNCALGADIHRDFRGKGYAKPMWGLMMNRAFGELDLHRVSLTTADYNDIGLRLYSALGFREEGRLTSSLLRDGAYHDQICMYFMRSWRR